jgi:photosystem II stability/assembly factor-like uncharacterized protein
MVVQLPPENDVAPPPADVEAGVIDDARARQRRERWAGAIVAALAVAAGLVFGLSGGGGGTGAGRHHGGGSAPGAGVRGSSQPVAVITHTPYVMQFGLLAPGVGWSANGAAFYLTRDGGRAWRELSRDTDNGSHYANVAVPGLGLDGDIGADITATASPAASVLALGFIDGRAAASCKPPATPAEGAGTIVLTANGGRTWSTYVLPGCSITTSLSFVSARVGFAVLGGTPRSSSLFRTDDGGRRWRLVSRFPAPMVISFGNRSDGLALVTENNKSGAGALYRTTDGGRTWQRSRFCGPTADPTLTVYCGEPSSFGRHGVVLAIAQDLARRTDRAFIYSTSDAGRHWTRHGVPPLDSPEMPAFSAPSANDLFVYSLNGVLHTTTNGGRSWTSIREPDFKDLTQMQFVSADYGWVLARGHFDYTTDAGRIWKPIGTR